jgi:hypothetical protein
VTAISDDAKAPQNSPQEETTPTETTGTSTIVPLTNGQQPHGETTEEIATTQGIAENQGVVQDPIIDKANIQQVADKIGGQIVQEDSLPNEVTTDIKNLLTEEIQNNPDGEISKSLEVNILLLFMYLLAIGI